jgi:glutaminyl-tRNA synthetase
MPNELDDRAPGGRNDALPPAANFLRNIIEEDLRSNKHGGRVATRFPPEPNGYLHIGHAKSICINFGLARDYGGVCHMRFDDTNPTKEETEYVESILDSVRWLGFDWGSHLYYASDYFEKLYKYAEYLIIHGEAYVDSLSPEEIREHRGTLTEPGRNSPYRNRSVDENLDMFRRMRAGEFPDGAHVLRLKIDMTSPNINLRDPTIYRIRHHQHHRTGDRWCIYPMYDYAHAISDALEHITHSICTLEFEDHRALYDWVVENLPVQFRPHQYEFARLNLTYTVLSKRKLIELVEGRYVGGWDDPRMPTLVGLRRRGYTPEAIRRFCDRIGVSKADSLIDMSILEDCLREDLNERAPRAMAVLRPVKLVIENYPEGAVEECEAPNHPSKREFGGRRVPFSRELYIERDDFMETPPTGYFRLVPGGEVRLRYAYIVKCTNVVKHPVTGEIEAIVCTYDPGTKSGSGSGRKVKGNIHWVSARHALDAEVRLYDRLFTVPNPAMADVDFLTLLNPASIEVLKGCKLEPMLAQASPEARFQFERNGYFSVDPVDSAPGAPVFNRSVTLRDSWTKAGRQG